jgi:hypothetical protein
MTDETFFPYTGRAAAAGLAMTTGYFSQTSHLIKIRAATGATYAKGNLKVTSSSYLPILLSSYLQK